MNALARLLALTLIGFGLCGCEPKERFAWSPDGKRAVVLWEDQLHLVDQEGKILDELPSGIEWSGQTRVQVFDWMPDGNGLVVSRVHFSKEWDEIRPLFSPEDARSIERIGEHIPEYIKSAAAIYPDEDDIHGLLVKMVGEGESLLMALQYAWEKDRPAFEEAMASVSGAMDALSKKDEPDLSYSVHEISVVNLNPERTEFGSLESGLRQIRGVRSLAVSPDGNRVALGRSTSDLNLIDLEILDLSSGKLHRIANGTSRAFDWDLKGESLVYLRSAGGKGGKLMRLQLQALPGNIGQTELEPARDLALAFVPFSPRVAVLPDGQVLFAGQPATFPATVEQLERRPNLFTVGLQGGEIRLVPTESGALPMDLGYFVPSPDGDRVAVVESGSDAVAVVDLESGKSELVSEPHLHWKCRTLPAWRNSDSLSFVALDREDQSVVWKMWSAEGKAENLSADWPEGATKDWLEYEEPKTD